MSQTTHDGCLSLTASECICISCLLPQVPSHWSQPVGAQPSPHLHSHCREMKPPCPAQVFHDLWCSWCCGKTGKKNNLREEGSFGSQFKDALHHVRIGMVLGAGGSLVTLEWCWPVLKVALPTSIKPLWKHAHKQAQGLAHT